LDILLPTKLGPGIDWRQTFYNIKTGESYFCECFRKAVRNDPSLGVTFSVTFRKAHPHVKYALDNKSFRSGICHLCTKTVPPPSFYRTYDENEFKRIYDVYIAKIKYQSETEITFREAENNLRKMLGYPLIGEGWESETLLFKRIEAEFPETEVIHHGRPKFLGRQEYDIWMPEYKIAIEYQGIQHYEPLEHLGGEEGLIKRQALDKKKLELSRANGVTLIYAEEYYDFQELSEKIKDAINTIEI